jgi:nucleoside-diphosphate-sugar epimerase
MRRIMRVLVTGSTGFVGSHAVEALQARSDVDLVLACRDRTRLPAGVKGTVHEGDLRDSTYLETLLDGIDVVIHAAAWTALWGHARRSEELFLKPSLDVIAAARKNGVKRFVFVSSTSVAAPGKSVDPMSRGTKRPYWPHEANVVEIETVLRAAAGPDFQVLNMRLGLFAGARYALGLLPILVPRLKTRLVPYVAGGRTGMTLTDGRDIGAALALAATVTGLEDFESFNIVGPEVPSAREVLEHLSSVHGLPAPLFSVPFPAAFAFGWLIEMLDPLVPFDPLVTRSIVHLLQETSADNKRAVERLGYRPEHHWKEAVDRQMAEMAALQKRPMKMARPLPRKA